MLVSDQSIDAQLQRVDDATAQKRPELTDVLSLYDNARPHFAILTHEKFLEIYWKVLLHSPLLRDLKPADYHLFPALQNFLNGKTFATHDELKIAVGDFSVAGHLNYTRIPIYIIFYKNLSIKIFFSGKSFYPSFQY